MDRLLTITKNLAWLIIISIAFNLLLIVIQIIVQSAKQEFYISIGFPFHFFYFNDQHGLHGSNILHFLYDGVISILTVSIGLIIFKRIYRKNFDENRSNEVLDSD